MVGDEGGVGRATATDRLAARLLRSRPGTLRLVGRVLLAGAAAGGVVAVVGSEVAQPLGLVALAVCLLFRTMAFVLERMVAAPPRDDPGAEAP